MSPLLVEALAHNGGVATRRDLRAAGVSPKALEWALRCGHVVSPCHGVVADGESWRSASGEIRHRRLLRVITAERPGAVAAGPSAAVVWDLPTAAGIPERPVLTTARSVARPQYGSSSPACVRRRAWLREDEVTVVGGVPVTGLVRTVVDVARGGSVPWGLAAADAACRRGVTPDELVAAVQAMAPVPGSRRAAVVASWADPRAESPLESVARAVMRLLGLPCPDLQVWVEGDGRRYRADMIMTALRTVVEVDGKVKYVGHGAAPEQAWKDKRRRDDFLSWGYEVERFVAADSYRPQRWGRMLLQAFHRAAARNGLPPPTIDPTFPAYDRVPLSWRS